MENIVFNGRILFLSANPQRITTQLISKDIGYSYAIPLRDDVSTDEITPIPSLAFFDERLGSYPYTGLKAGTETPIKADAIKKGGFSVVVAGKRYGKGSSREHSPLAEKYAGIQLVIAESFERIYRQNADNIGLYTSTDFDLIERILRRETISMDSLTHDRDPLSAHIIRCGGLLKYGEKNLKKATTKKLYPIDQEERPLSFFEKILYRHIDTNHHNIKSGAGVFLNVDWRFIHEYYTGMCAHMLNNVYGSYLKLYEPDSIIAFEDHLSYMHKSKVHIKNNLIADLKKLSEAHRAFVSNHHIKSHGYLNGEGSEGISHALMIERYALPGEIVIGTDSHTSHSGAVGCLSFGVGTTDMANSLITGAARMTVPQCLLVELHGTLGQGVTAKDIVLKLLMRDDIKAGIGVGKVFEFVGPVIESLSIDERATLTNMTAELGGFTGLIAPDKKTIEYLYERRGIKFELEPWMKSDTDAFYAYRIQMDCSLIEPMVASPGDPGNGLLISEIKNPVKIDIAYGGSCTAGKREDFDQYYTVLSWAVSQGMRVAPNVNLYLQFGTVDVREYCQQKNYIEVFERVGASLLQPACGACANCGPGSSESASQVTISAINRNFPGRSGPGDVWLASPLTVAASAIAGQITSFETLKQTARKVLLMHHEKLIPLHSV